MKVLGRVRLSRSTTESTSIERQKELIEQWSALHEHEIVGWAEDVDCPGSIHPMEAPALSPWFGERAGEWEVMAIWRLDRLSRRVIALNEVFGWMLRHDKILVSITESLDLSNWTGRLVANVLAGVAEGESQAIVERTKASRMKLVQLGRWPGGHAPYGLTPVELAAGGWQLQPDPQQAAVIRRIAAELIGGAAVEAVANRLNEDGIPSPKGVKWTPQTLFKMTQAKYLLGHSTYGGETVRDAEGFPVLISEPVLDAAEWDQLQAAVQLRKSGPISRTRNVSPLLNVALCFECEQPLFHRVYRRNYGKNIYRYYHCRDNHTGMVEAGMVEELLEEAFLDAVGERKVLERVFRKGENHETELEDAIRAVDELSMLLGTITSATMRSRLTEQMTALDSRITLLETMPTREAGYEYIQTGVSYRQQWEQADTEGKRQLLLKSGITYRTKRIPGTQAVQSAIFIPDEILDLLNTKKP
jgi:DNA invertase Pin-like site-specific DNA recombinase